MDEATPKERVGDNNGNAMRSLITYKYSKKVVRLSIAMIVIIEEFPFGIVE